MRVWLLVSMVALLAACGDDSTGAGGMDDLTGGPGGDPGDPNNPNDPNNQADPGDPNALGDPNDPNDPNDPGNLGDPSDPVEGTDEGASAPGLRSHLIPEGTPNPCGISTAYSGDQYCILPPPADQGFQLHVGPGDHTDAQQLAAFELAPGEETNDYWYIKSGNAQDIYYYKRQYRMRPGSHHMIVNTIDSARADGWGPDPRDARRIGGSQNSYKDNPEGEIAPENVGLGMPLAGTSQMVINLHNINTTDQPILREAWVNVWYVDQAEVTQEASEVFMVGGLGYAIQPGTHQVYNYSCPVQGDGRLLVAYGHRHAHSLRFSAWRVRGDQRDLIVQDYNWEEPEVLQFNSVTENPAPTDTTAGGWSGILDLQRGDRLEWECEMNNTSDSVLRFTNEAFEGEMCLLIGDAVGLGVECNQF